MVKQKIISYNPSTSPDHMLNFSDIIQRGFNIDDKSNERVTVSLMSYPLALYVAYKYILLHPEIVCLPSRIQYISDIQVFSTKLGIAIVQEMNIYKELKARYNHASESNDFFVQDSLENAINYTFTNVKHRRRSIKVLYYVRDEAETMGNIFGLYPSSLMIHLSIIGLLRAKLPKKIETPLIKEYESFIKFIEFTATKYSVFGTK